MNNLGRHIYTNAVTYESVPSHPSSEYDENASAEKGGGDIYQKHTSRNIALSKALLILYLGISSLVSAAIILLAALYVSPDSRQCAEKLSPYSPMFDAVEYYETDFNNPFAHPSIYRGPPTPEIEMAWERLWNRGTITVSDEGIDQLNKTQSGPHKKSTKEEGKNVALVEVFHQLHCLNVIRQYTWRHLYTVPPGDLEDPVGARMHVDHCIESIRLSLMCYGDVTPVLIEVDPESPIGITADFNVHHVCRNFERITEWVEENGSPPSKPNRSEEIKIVGHEG